MTTEVVLPNGVFASVRNITVGDMLAVSSVTPGLPALLGLACLCVTLDGAPTGLDVWKDMSYADFAPVLHALNKQLEAAFQTREGIA